MVKQQTGATGGGVRSLVVEVVVIPRTVLAVVVVVLVVVHEQEVNNERVTSVEAVDLQWSQKEEESMTSKCARVE